MGFVSYSQEVKSDVATKPITVSQKEFYPTMGVSFNLESISTINIIVKDKTDKVVFDQVYPDVKISNLKLDLSSLSNDDYNIYFYSKGDIIVQEKIKKNLIKN